MGSIRVLTIGGTTAHPGGVEAFCARAAEAFDDQSDIRLLSEYAETAFLPLKNLPELFFRAWKLIRRHRHDISGVWLQYVNLPDLIYLAVARLHGLPVLVTPHLGTNWRSQSNPILRTISHFMLSLSSGVALLSSTQEAEIALPRNVPRRIVRTFLPSHLWSDPLPEKTEDRSLRLMHSARLSEGKGTFLFVDLCAKLQTQGISFSACITGGADEETMGRLRSCIAEAGLTDRIKIMGLVGVDEQLRELRSADVLIHLSRIDSYPLIVLEALACGVFPICLDLAGARDMIQTYAGRLVSGDQLAEKAADVLMNTDLSRIRQEAIAAAKQVRDDYRWDECSSLLAPVMWKAFGESA